MTKISSRLRFWLILSCLGLLALGSIGVWLNLPQPLSTRDISAHTATLPHYGIAAGSRLTTLSDQELSQELDSLRDLGVGWVRFDFDWSQIQPDGPNQAYDWSATDRIVEGANARGLHVLAILDFAPDWARRPDCRSEHACAPANPQAFAQFAGAAAAHYHNGQRTVEAWEIWNEPNSVQFWLPQASPSDYTALLKASYQAIKHENGRAIVLTGGTSPQPSNGQSLSPTDFVKGIYANGAKPYFDALAHHPYTFPVLPSYQSDHAWAQMSTSTPNLRQIMVDNGDSVKRIWITEFGAPTGGPGDAATLTSGPPTANGPWHVDEALQSAMVKDAVKLYRSYDWAGPLFWYSYKDAGDTSDTNENFFGLVRADNSHKPAYDVFQQIIHSP